MAKPKTDLDEKVIDQFYKLGEELRKIPESTSAKTLHDLVNSEVQTYYMKNSDKEKGHLKFKSDEEARTFAGNLWDKSADHIAQTYLGMDKKDIDKLKKQKDQDGNNMWETFMRSYIGVDRDAFQDQVANLEEINPHSLYDQLVKPIYSHHVGVRQSQRMHKTIRTTEDAQNALKYMAMVKKHNPETYKGAAVPKKIASVQDIYEPFSQWVGSMPRQYNPLQPETHEATYKKEKKK